MPTPRDLETTPPVDTPAATAAPNPIPQDVDEKNPRRFHIPFEKHEKEAAPKIKPHSITPATPTTTKTVEKKEETPIHEKPTEEAGKRTGGRGLEVSKELPLGPYPTSDISLRRMIPTYTSSHLRPGAKFVGKQTSDNQTYEVTVELKYVDMAESFLCGYLCIQGLTQDHPTLTTFFQGEMIGPRYSFRTHRPDLESDAKNDLQHWKRFPPFEEVGSKMLDPDFVYEDFEKKDHIFMRWKECFLVPDHTVRQIAGASFAGFYYICFNQASGRVSGIYYHAKSERWQKLELEKCVERTWGSIEFR